MTSAKSRSRTARARNFLRDNGFLLACLGLFAVFFTGMIVSGAATYNEQQREHGSSEEVTLVGYLKTGDCRWEWESS